MQLKCDTINEAKNLIYFILIKSIVHTIFCLYWDSYSQTADMTDEVKGKDLNLTWKFNIREKSRRGD